ncbi:DUF4062 domain-containing protein [Cryobacterium sp. 10S3]|uniref:DUF4062 domain-containing protein n=1 Tax=Cryobacterium sp. 10S3 TaxID=3048582 RepID=UPI002AC98B87|nr:DUF4062 domain-containing protein [Cryobacterium sp. 10S3]MEB0287132.1 DUF4062 domain-containing protein [Cryobacterium sp. 10S3]WPX12269.1 DUF4062 domain-containing protein [Cryobacterium sp. 10S3]
MIMQHRLAYGLFGPVHPIARRPRSNYWIEPQFVGGWRRADMSNVNELRVFIASPGDLAEERAELRDIERRVNSLFGATGQRVRVTGWEETLPAFGRPQGQINPMVDDCDVFVGLLRRKWGSPTGISDSGFSEEFERALDRRKRSGTLPEIAMYFANLSQGELDDAGPELNRVLDFRRRLETERLALYSTFTTPDNLAAQVAELLSGHLLGILLARQASEGPVGAITASESMTTNASTDQLEDIDEGESSPDSAQKQLVEALDALRGALTGSASITPLDNDRLELAGVALGRDKSPLRTHLVNRLYQRLDGLDLIGAEFHAWVRTLLTDVGEHPAVADRVVPGWFLLAGNEADRTDKLVQFATEEGLVGRGAVMSLYRLGARPTILWNDAAIEATVAQGQPNLAVDLWIAMLNANPGHSEVTNYLLQDATIDKSEATEVVTKLIGRILESSDLNDDSRAFLDATIQAFAGRPDDLARRLGYSSDAPGPWRLILGQIENLGSTILNGLANQSYNREVKLTVTERGLTAGLLTDATLKSLLFERDEDIRGLLLAASAKNAEVATLFLALTKDRPTGKSVPTGLEGRLLADSTSLEVLERLDAQSEYSNAPWEALTYLTPAKLMPSARRVLIEDAAELRSSLRERIGDEENIISYLADDRKRISAGLLSRNVDHMETDVRLVLTWFKENALQGFIADQDWHILENTIITSGFNLPTDFFDAYEDVSGFSSAAKFLNGPLGPSIAPVLRRNEIAWFREPAEVWYITRKERTNDEIEEALYSDLPNVRIAAAQSMCDRLDRETLKSVLEKYPTRQGQYWYNVSAILDEHLYAPTRSGS